MTTFLIILMVVLLSAGLERSNRRRSPRGSGLHGSVDHDDRDWDRTRLDLMALRDSAKTQHHHAPRFA